MTDGTLLPPVATLSSRNGSRNPANSGPAVAFLVAFASLICCLHYPEAPILLTKRYRDSPT